jgi:hypothetical protein
MKNAHALLPALILAACAGTYEAAMDGPTITLRVEPDIKPGIPVISYHDLTLYLDQMGSKIPGTNVYDARSLGVQRIADNGGKEPFILPATSPLKVALAYRSDALFGPALVGSQAYVLIPEAGAAYVMKFWTDKERFSVQLFKQDPSGALVPARAAAVPALGVTAFGAAEQEALARLRTPSRSP